MGTKPNQKLIVKNKDLTAEEKKTIEAENQKLAVKLINEAESKIKKLGYELNTVMVQIPQIQITPIVVAE